MLTRTQSNSTLLLIISTNQSTCKYEKGQCEHEKHEKGLGDLHYSKIYR